MAKSRVRGVSALRRQLRRLPAEVTSDIGDVMTKLAPELASAIEDAAPKDEGRLADATIGQVSRDKLGIAVGYSQNRSGFKRAWVKGGFEALFQEFGTRHHAAQPFISPTFRAKLPEMLRRVETAVIQSLKKARRWK